MPVPTIGSIRQAEELFSSRWNFPNCFGAIDGKHIRVVCPMGSGSKYYNYKGFSSIVLLATVSGHYRFTMIDVGDYGSQNDSGVFRNSQFGRLLSTGQLPLPEPKEIEEGGPPLPYVLVGDEAFPLSTYLLRPYPGHHLSDKKAVYNYPLSRARRISENAFGIFSNKWKIFHRPIQMKVENICAVVKASCVLHNFVRRIEGKPAQEKLVHNDAEDLPLIVEEVPLIRLASTRGNEPQRAKEIQEQFADYFMGSGRVEWQMRSIGRG